MAGEAVEQGEDKSVMWLGDVVGAIVGQILFEGLLKTVLRYPVAFICYVFLAKGRTFDEYLDQTEGWAIGQGLIGLGLLVIGIWISQT